MRGEQLQIVILIIAAAAGITLLAPTIWLVVLTDGLFVAALLLAAAGWGAWPTVWLGLRGSGPWRQLCVAAALGLGLLGFATLTLGALGVLSRPLAWMLLSVGGAGGLARLYMSQRGAAREPTDEENRARDESPPDQVRLGNQGMQALLVLTLSVPLVVVLFGACLPPGVLWAEEAGGYDVLEYHLQGPREYYQAGRITFLPHNVYTSFPQQMEMLYLLLMHLAGDVYAAAIPAQLLHAACGVLAVFALACWTKPGWQRVVVVVLAGTTPWLAYVGSLAYVENGLIFFAAVAAGLLIHAISRGARADWRTVLAAGLCAGLAGGCKYTALALVPAGLGFAWLVASRGSFHARARRLAVFLLGSTLAFSPWLVRNAAFTNNAVYPFAYGLFGGKGWSAGQAQQWSQAHRVPSEQNTLPGRLSIAARELFGSVDKTDATKRFRPSLFGFVLFIAAGTALVLSWSRQATLLTLWTVFMLLIWGAFTFMPGRFVMPVTIPLALLAGGTVEQVGGNTSRFIASRRSLIVFITLVGAVANDAVLAARLGEHHRRWRARTGLPMSMLVGQTDSFAELYWLNEALPPDAYAWLVGDAAVFYVQRRIHYTVPFSRDPWIEFAGSGASAESCLAWLGERGVTHVVFSWGEIGRLRRTYGFSDIVTPPWVARLEQAGLRPVQAPTAPPSVRVYEVPGPAAG